jgi:hypothetical protein
MEEILDKKLTGTLFGFKTGTKTAAEVQALIDRMKEVNAAQADDWNKKFVEAARQRKIQEEQKSYRKAA